MNNGAKHALLETGLVGKWGFVNWICLFFKYDKKRAKVKDAEMHYFREWWGWNLGVKHACLWGAPQDIPNIKSLKYKLRSLLIDRFLILFSAVSNTVVTGSVLANQRGNSSRRCIDAKKAATMNAISSP